MPLAPMSPDPSPEAAYSDTTEMAPTSTPPIPGSPFKRPTEALEERASDMSITPAWTEEDEEELADIKAKLHRAHKSWSAEQELWHDRVRLQKCHCHHLERSIS